MIISPVRMYYHERNDDHAMMMFIDYMCKLEGNFFFKYMIFSKGKNVKEPIRTTYALSKKTKRFASY